MKLPRFTLLFISLLSLFSCTPNNNDNPINGGDKPTKEVTFKEAVDNTIKNYSFESVDKQIDNLDATQSHFSYKQVKYNEDQKMMVIRYNTIFTTSEDVFLTYKNNETYFSTNVYYTNSEDQIICRYKNRGEDSVFDDMQYTSSNQDVFTTQMINYINPDHFTFNESDNFYYMNSEYLNSEEASRLAGYYGSYQYLEQNYSYIAFSIKDGHLDNYKMSVHFAARSGNSFPYDADNEVTGFFYEVKTTNIELPPLPIYHEDTLIADEKIVNAKERAKKNYTYNETVSVIDSNGNERELEYIEGVEGDTFRHYSYSFIANCYSDVYSYTIYKDSFNGGKSASTHETCIYYYDDYVDYQDYDMDILDDSISTLEALGGKYGIKVFEEKEDSTGKYFTPSREKPTKYNPKDYTYLDYACSSFIHGIIGNYVDSNGTIYSYKYNDLRFYLDDNGDFYKATYSFDMDYTKDGITTSYHVVGNGTFKDINKTKIVIPTNPNDEIVLDERLSKLYSAMNNKNYTYKETYNCFTKSGDNINFSKEDERIEDTMLYNEYVDDSRIKQELTCNVIFDYDENENPIYRFATLNDYYYFGEEGFYNYYAFDDFYSNYKYYPGQYEYKGVIDSYKNNLKYFKYVNSKTINGELVDVFKLTSSYLKLFGKELVISASQSRYSSVTSLQLYVKDERIIRVSYAYDYNDENNNYIGECEGTINIDFNSTVVEVPNVDLSFINNTLFEDTMNKYSSSSYYIDSRTNVSCFSNRTTCEAYYLGKYNLSDIETEQEFTYQYGLNHDLVATFDENGKSYDITIVPYNYIDFSKFNRDDFYLDGNSNYNLVEDKYDEYFANVFHFDETVDIKPIMFYLNISNSTITITYQYHLRYLTKDGNYVLYYINGTLKITN